MIDLPYQDYPRTNIPPVELKFLESLPSSYPEFGSLGFVSFVLTMAKCLRCGWKNGQFWFVFQDRRDFAPLSFFKIPYFYRDVSRPTGERFIVFFRPSDFLSLIIRFTSLNPTSYETKTPQKELQFDEASAAPDHSPR